MVTLSSIVQRVTAFLPGRGQAVMIQDKLYTQEARAKDDIDDLVERFQGTTNPNNRINLMRELVTVTKDYATSGLLDADIKATDKGHYLVPIFRDILKNDKDPAIRILAVSGLDHLRTLGNIKPILDDAREREGNQIVIDTIDNVFFIRNWRNPEIDPRPGL